MHYLTYVLVPAKADDIAAAVDDALLPFRKVQHFTDEEVGADEDHFVVVFTSCERCCRFDWYLIGGRSDGYITGRPYPMESMFDMRPLDDAKIADNSVLVPQLIQRLEADPDLYPCAIATHDGQWQERERDWRDKLRNGQLLDAWTARVMTILSQYPDCTAVAVDCHI